METSCWAAELELWLEPRNGLTRLIRRRHIGPLLVQRPFHPESDGAAHIYVLHPPGGVAGGDQLDITCHLSAGARALLTTPGATKFYRSESSRSTQRTLINVGPGAVCEYLPQETIVFSGANAHVETRVSLATADATYIGWEFVSLGRPAAGERFASGAVKQRVEVLCEGRPIWFERLSLDGDSCLSHAPFAFRDQPIVGTMVYIGPIAETAAQRVRECLDESARGVFSISQLDRAIVCRYLGSKMSEGKSLFIRAWDVLRDEGQGKRASIPRIWAT
ncbi:urease accessory protein UreD [Bradyrhizobium sp. RDM12]